MRFRSSLDLRVSKQEIVSATLSSPATSLVSKPLVGAGHAKVGRHDPLEHVFEVQQAGRIIDPRHPVLVIGVRNVLSNLRCIAYNTVMGALAGPHSVVGENPSLGERPYYALQQTRDGCLSMEALSPTHRDAAWYCSGVPVLWDDLAPDELWRRIVAEAADHAHIYHLPRGDHPNATAESRSAWQQLHDIFVATLNGSVDQAYEAISSKAQALGLQREASYYHSAIGLRPDGDLVLSVAHAKLEELGERVRRLGARRAICFENSGSVTVMLYSEGIEGLRKEGSRWLIEGSERSLIAAPNHRRMGTAFLILELHDGFTFDVLPPAGP